jgi:hypothetical protein
MFSSAPRRVRPAAIALRPCLAHRPPPRRLSYPNLGYLFKPRPLNSGLDPELIAAQPSAQLLLWREGGER